MLLPFKVLFVPRHLKENIPSSDVLQTRKKTKHNLSFVTRLDMKRCKSQLHVIRDLSLFWRARDLFSLHFLLQIHIRFTLGLVVETQLAFIIRPLDISLVSC